MISTDDFHDFFESFDIISWSSGPISWLACTRPLDRMHPVRPLSSVFHPANLFSNRAAASGQESLRHDFFWWNRCKLMEDVGGSGARSFQGNLCYCKSALTWSSLKVCLGSLRSTSSAWCILPTLQRCSSWFTRVLVLPKEKQCSILKRWNDAMGWDWISLHSS